MYFALGSVEDVIYPEAHSMRRAVTNAFLKWPWKQWCEVMQQRNKAGNGLVSLGYLARLNHAFEGAEDDDMI